MRHYGSKQAEYWTSQPATRESHAFLVPFTNFQNRCLGDVMSTRLQPRVDQRSHLTMRDYGSKQAEYWTSQPATTKSHAFLVAFTNFQNLYLGGVRSPRSQPRVGQGSHLTIRHYGSKLAEYWTSLPATTESHAFLFLLRTPKIVAWVV